MKKVTSALIGVSLAASMALASNVVKSTDGRGDFLIAPLYVAKGNVCTKVTVYNTNTTRSILAKVAFREQTYSNEVDIPIFLSPGDVWTGKLCQQGSDVYLYSNDDSNHPQAKAMLAKGVDITSYSVKSGHTDVDFSTGYIEVYPIAEFNERSDAKVAKSILVNRWDSLIKGKYPSNTLKRVYNDLAGNVEYVDKNDPTPTSILPMTAFKNAHSKTLTGQVVAYGNDTNPYILLGREKTTQILKILQHKTTTFTYSNYGKNQFIAFDFPFGYNHDQIRKFEIEVRDTKENKDVKKEVVIFSPAPKINKSNYMKNEVAIISVADLISKTSNPKLFKEGQIQIKDITNVTDVQFGPGKHASFIPTFFMITNNKITNAHYIPTK